MKAESKKKTAKKSRGATKSPRPKKVKPVKAKTGSARSDLTIPPILLEGDVSPPTPVSGPGQRYALGPLGGAERAPRPVTAGELPEAYGTKRLLLTARDPHWLYAHWDFTRQQLQQFNKLSTDGHLVLRIYREAISGPPFTEIHVHPESRNWFVHVGEAGTQFLGELGYYGRSRKWVRLSTSGATLTPPDTMSDDLSITFETLPPDLQFSQLIQLVKSAVSENVPLVEALQQLRATGYPGLPESREIQAKRWTPEQEATLARVVNMDAVRRVWMGSLEITEVIRRQLHQEMWSAAAAQLAQAGLWSGAMPGGISSLSSLSSPFGGQERPKSFWFNVNAELVIYGATEPDAAVTIGGRRIRLRDDGTFSYRFALPDGNYFLPAVATSADGTDQRTAELSFQRQTRYHGDVGQHAQDSRLKPPHASNLA